ncbi:MAG: hypothetical protein AAFY06_15175, partial [Pseudomonadota bacterium]
MKTRLCHVITVPDHKSGRMKRVLATSTALFPAALISFPAEAADFLTSIGTTQVFAFSAFVATLAFSIVSTVSFMRSRNRANPTRDAMAKELAILRARSERYESLIEADDQRLIIWSSPEANAHVIGRLPPESDAPADPATFIAFGKWLAPASAAGLERHISDLRHKGEAFQIAVSTKAGNYLDALGKTVGGRVFVRFRDLTGDQQVMMELRRQLQDKSQDVETYQALLQEIEQPVWLSKAQDQTTRVHWANDAYRKAVGDDTSTDDKTALLDSSARNAVAACHAEGSPFKERVNAVANGERVTFDVVSVPTDHGSAAIATDVSEAQKA